MQNLDQIFESEMGRVGLRITQNRRAIFAALRDAGRPLSIQEIIMATDAESYFTSVYRSVEAMTNVKILRLVPRGLKNNYELGEKFQPHHHHATCEKCGRTVQVHNADLEKMMRKLTIDAGLKPAGHQFELFGVCRECRVSNDL